MKSTVLFPSLLFVLSVAVAAVSLAKEPDVMYVSHPSQFPQTAVIQKLTSLPEWESFWTLFSDAVDKGIDKELTNRDKLERVLPAPVAERLAAGVEKRGFRFREAVDEIFTHLKTIVFMIDSDGDDDDDVREEIVEMIQKIDQAVAGKKKIDLDFEGMLALIVDVNPRNWLDLLKGFQENRDYKFLKNEPDGDFILEFDYEYRGQDIEFSCASVKLPGTDNLFALIFSDDDHIQRQAADFKAGKTGVEFLKKDVERIAIGERCFVFWHEYGKTHHWNEGIVSIIGKIRGFEAGGGDVDGVTQIEAKLSMRNSEDAKAIHDMIAGLIAMGQLTVGSDKQKEDAREIVKLLETITLNVNGNDVAATIKLDHPMLWKLTSKLLKKASDDMMKKK